MHFRITSWTQLPPKTHKTRIPWFCAYESIISKLENYFDTWPTLRIRFFFEKIPSNSRFLDSLYQSRFEWDFLLQFQARGERCSEWEPHLPQNPTWLLSTIKNHSGRWRNTEKNFWTEHHLLGTCACWVPKKCLSLRTFGAGGKII